MASEKARQKIGEALLALLAEKPWSAIELAEIAAHAGLTLAQLRAAYDGKLAIWADIVRRFDAKVLEGEDPAMAGEPARDRLFDVLMRRYDVMSSAKASLRGLLRSAEHDPPLAAALLPIAVTSQRWMLAAAGLSGEGFWGRARAQALALGLAPVTRTWLGEDDAGLPKTMAALDRALRRLEGYARDVDRLASLLRPFARRRERVADPPAARETGEEPGASLH